MYVTQTLEKEKSSVHSGQLLLSPKRIEKKKERNYLSSTSEREEL
jgi:hypothetical protein